MKKEKYSITIWNPEPKEYKKELSKKQINYIIKKILEKEQPYSFDVYKILEDDWRIQVYEYHTSNEFIFKKKQISYEKEMGKI